MDSTSVAVTAQEVLKSRGADFDLRAYTLVFERFMDEEEGRFAEMVAAKSGLSVERVVVDEYWTGTRQGDVTWATPEPSALPYQSSDREVGRRVAGFARGLLTGLGGDPLFAVAGPAGWNERTRWAWSELRRGRLPCPGVRTALRSGRARAGVGVRRLPDWIEPGFARRWDLEARLREVDADWDGVTGTRALLHPIWPSRFAQGHPGAAGLPLKALFPFFDVRLARCVLGDPAPPLAPGERSGARP